MSTTPPPSPTPSKTGPGGPGGALPKKPAAYPVPKPSVAPAASPTPAAPSAAASPSTRAHGITPGQPAPAPAAPGAGSKSVTSASVTGPIKPGGKPDLFSRRNLIVGGSVAGALVLLVALLVWRPWSPRPPRLNDQPYKIAQFAATPAMDKLPWSQQREYMHVLDDKEEALRQAYKDQKLDDQQFRRALQLGWYDKHLDRMDKFFNRPPALRILYIDEKVLGKKIKKKQEHAGGPATHPLKMPAPGKAPKPKKEKDTEKSDDLSPLKPEEIDRDDSTEEQDIKKWPADVRTKWAEYRAVLTQRKEYFKEQDRLAKEKRKAAAATADAKADDAKAGDAKPADAKPGDAKPGDAKPGDAGAADATSGNSPADHAGDDK